MRRPEALATSTKSIADERLRLLLPALMLAARDAAAVPPEEEHRLAIKTLVFLNLLRDVVGIPGGLGAVDRATRAARAFLSLPEVPPCG